MVSFLLLLDSFKLSPRLTNFVLVEEPFFALLLDFVLFLEDFTTTTIDGFSLFKVLARLALGFSRKVNQ